MKKFFSLIAAVLFAGSMMAEEATMTAGTNGSACTVNDVAGIKCGTSSKAGDMTITVGAGATKLTFYAAAWKGVTGLSLNLAADGVTISPASVSLTADDGISNNSPFTLAGLPENFKFEVDLTGVTAETVISVTSSAAKRFVVWGASYEAGGVTPPAVATPVISGEAEFTESVIVTITCSTPEADIYYTTDGTTDPKCDCAAAPEYTQQIVLTETTTIMAAAYTGNDWSAVATKTFTKKEPLQPITCAAVYELAKDAELALNNVVVTYANGKNVYVQDATGSMLLYLNSNTTWEAGNILSGVEGKLDIYNGLYEVKMTDAQAAAVQPGQGEAPAPVEFTAAPVAADMNKYIVLKNVTVSAETFPSNKNMNATIGEETFVLRNQFNADIAFDTNKAYDITGVVALYNSTVQVYFINAEEATAPVADEWVEIKFVAAATADEIDADASFTVDGFTVAITDPDNKMSIDANDCRFGTATDYKMYSHRLKSGGKSSATKNFITLTIPEAGTLRIAVRTGSNSATDRNLVLKQGDDTLYNQVIVETMAVKVMEGETEVSVYPFVEVPVEAGTVALSYPVNGLNFYAFAFKAAGGETPVVLDAPDAAPAAPTYPANQVHAMYSATYNADCGFGEWGSGTQVTQEEFGKKYVTTQLGYFGMEFPAGVDCSNMEALHLDVWAANDFSLRVVPIHGGTEVGKTVAIEGQKWNAIDIPLTEFVGVENWSNVIQIKIDEARDVTFWLNNVYFYTTQEQFTYTVAGSSAIAFGTTWDPANAENDMVRQADGTYKWEKTNLELAAGELKFKVCENHAWTHAWPAQDYALAISEGGLYTVTITFNPAAEADQVAAVAQKTGEAVVLPNVILHGNFSGSWADTDPFVAAADRLTAALTLTLAEGTYEFGFKFDGAWKANGANITRDANTTYLATGEGNMHITADVAGDYVLVYTFATQELVVTYPVNALTIPEDAPVPTAAEEDVMAIYCNHYATNNANFGISGWAGGYQTLVLNEINVGYWTAMTWECIIDPAHTDDAHDFSAYKNLHVDLWAPLPAKIKFTAEAVAGGNYKEGQVVEMQQGWNNVDFVVAEWPGNYDFKNLKCFVFEQYQTLEGVSFEGNPFAFANIYFYGKEGQGIDNTNVEMNAVKFIENGQLIILKNGVKYNVMGVIVR